MYNGLSQVYLSNQKEESISIQRVNPLWTGNLLTCILHLLEVPNEMTQNAIFLHCLHCLPRQKQTSRIEIRHYFKTTCHPSTCAMDHPAFIAIKLGGILSCSKKGYGKFLL